MDDSRPWRARELVEGREYTEFLKNLGQQQLDRALRAVYWALSTNPEAFPIVPGFKDIRLVKTEPLEFGPSMMPPLRIWFRISPDGQRVYLEHIERDSSDVE